MMIVSDGGDRDRGLPETYGVDDLPIVLQDKRFGRNGELLYSPSMMDVMHGFQGDTLVVNGAIAPVASVPAGFVRLRLLNAANARNFDLRFSDRRPFFVIGSDGGLLPEPVEVRNLVIAPAERYEILVNFSDGRPVELVTGPDIASWNGPRHDDDADGSCARSRGTETFMRFIPDPALKAAVTRLPRTADNLGGAGHQVCRRVENLRARSDDGNGSGHDGHDGDGDGRNRRRPQTMPVTTMPRRRR